MSMTFKEFAATQGITYEAVRKRVDSLKDNILKGHIIKESGIRYLDDFAIDILKDRSEATKKVAQTAQAAEKSEVATQLLSLQQNFNEQLTAVRVALEDQRKENTDLKVSLARAEVTIEAANKALEEKDATLAAKDQAMQNLAYGLKEKIAAQQKDLEDTKAQLERLQHRNLWQRIFNKD